MAISFPPSNPNPPGSITDPFALQAPTVPTQPSDISLSTATPTDVAPVSSSTPQLALTTFYAKVAAALSDQKNQELLAAFQSFQSIRAIFVMLGNLAAFNSLLQSEYISYDGLQQHLAALDLDTLKSKLDQAEQAFNNTDPANTLNDAIDKYNIALNNYKSTFAAYQSQVTTLQAAQNAYDQKLAQYNNGDITLAVLQSAQTTFNNAKTAFDNSTAVKNFNTDQTKLISAETNLKTARDNFNSASLPQPQTNNLNTAIQNWDAAVQQAQPIIAAMNQLRPQLFGDPPLPTPPLVSQVGSLPTFTLPPDIPIISTGVSGAVTTYNLTVTTVTNPAIDDVGNPSIKHIVQLPSTFPTGFGSVPLDTFSIQSPFIYVSPPIVDVQSFLAALLKALDEGTPIQQTAVTQQSAVQDNTDTEDPLVIASQKHAQTNTIGGVGASVAMSTINAKVALQSPYLEVSLSRQTYDTIFNEYGVPAGSALVDQMGKLVSHVKNLAGLSSVNPAQQILGANISGITPPGLQAATALANLGELSRITSSDLFQQTVANLVATDPTLTTLSADQKASLTLSLTNEVSSSLLKGGLEELASALNLPGLVPQILAVAAGITTNDGLASFGDQLYEEVLLSQQLSATTGLSSAEAEQLVMDAYQEALKKNVAATAENIKNFILDNLSKMGKLQSDSARKITDAQNLVATQIKQERDKNEVVKNEAFKKTLYDALIQAEIDPAKAETLSNQASFANLDALKALLQANNLTEDEAKSVIAKATSAYQSKDGNYNPAGTFLAEHLGTTTELAARFKLQVINILSPVVGLRQAREVAENYGTLIFSTGNSVVTRLQANERDLRSLSAYNSDARLFEDYRDATLAYRNPQLADSSPAHLGAVLLMTGLGGGLSAQGTTSADNVTGPLANRSKHATSYPGILG